MAQSMKCGPWRSETYFDRPTRTRSGRDTCAIKNSKSVTRRRWSWTSPITGRTADMMLLPTDEDLQKAGAVYMLDFDRKVAAMPMD